MCFPAIVTCVPDMQITFVLLLSCLHVTCRSVCVLLSVSDFTINSNILSEFGLNQEICPSTPNVLSVQGEPGGPGPKVRSCLYGKLWNACQSC